jgi:putative nucleotidyltransferase with HDIG domain
MAPLEFDAYEELTTRIPTRELATLLRVSSSLASTMELSEILQIAIESAADLLRLGTGAIYTLDEKTLLLGATTPPLPPQFPDELRIASLDDHLHIRQAVAAMAPVYIQDAREASLTEAERVVVETRKLISILYFPLLLKKEAIGAFIVATTDSPRRFTPTEIDLCYMLSFQVSLAIANSRLYQTAQRAIMDISHAYDATLAGWSRVLDMRDHVTDEHTHRVADLAVALARKMGVPEADIGHVRRGALLHDIGKMALPDSILQKTESLTEDEWKAMRTHPEKAYELLSHIEYSLLPPRALGRDGLSARVERRGDPPRRASLRSCGRVRRHHVRPSVPKKLEQGNRPAIHSRAGREAFLSPRSESILRNDERIKTRTS